LAAAETADLLKNHVAGDAEAGEHITALLFDEFLVARSDSVKHLHLFIEAGQHLVEVAGLDATSKDDAPRVGLQLAEQAAEERRLAAAVGTENAPFLAAQDIKREIFEERLARKALGELFNAKDDVA